MSRLTIDLTEQQHRDIKAVAALQGKTIKQYAVERLFPAEDDGDRAWAEFKAFIGKRVDNALAGKLSTRTIDEIFDEVLSEGDAA